MAKFEVNFTASVQNPDTEEEFHGFISPEWSKTQLFSEATDVKTFEFETREDAEKFIEETIGEADNFDGEDWYAADSHFDLESGEDWSYHARITEQP